MSSFNYRISDLFQDPMSLLGKLINQAKSLENLNKLFVQLLDPTLIPYCRIGDYQSGVLTLFVKNAAFATQIRYQIPDILSQLRQFPTWAGLCSIQVKVATSWPAPPAPTPTAPSTMLKIPEESAELFERLAQSLANEPGAESLVNSLMNIAKHR